MGNFIDLIGQRFGRLVAVKDVGRDTRGEVLWLCNCDCGNISIVLGGNLRSGHIKSCGCLRKETSKNLLTTHGLSRDLNGEITRLYSIWNDIKRRCLNKKRCAYKHYGGRGITVCLAWLQFPPFYQWAISHGYQKELTIERKNNDGNYCPENCIWIPLEEQARNRRDSHYITYNGETKTIAEWAEIRNIGYGTLWFRLTKTDWNIEQAFNAPIKRNYLITYNGETKALHEWAKIRNMKYITLYSRLTTYGWSIEKAFNTPIGRRKNAAETINA